MPWFMVDGSTPPIKTDPFHPEEFHHFFSGRKAVWGGCGGRSFLFFSEPHIS